MNKKATWIHSIHMYEHTSICICICVCVCLSILAMEGNELVYFPEMIIVITYYAKKWSVGEWKREGCKSIKYAYSICTLLKLYKKSLK